MAGELSALGELVATCDARRIALTEQIALDQAVRASLLCVLLGAEREPWVFPFRTDDPDRGARWLAGLYDGLDGIARLGTLAGAADLDPMDPGPSHTVLPATLAACIAGGDDRRIADGVLAGVEAAWRLRRAVSGTRPGVGFHSPGVYGTVAAAAAAARVLGLRPAACTQAIAIALTRAAGLAINSAASLIGMTHFGWGAAHGLEAALFAGQGWEASTDLEKALGSLFGGATIDPDSVMTAGSAVAGLVFKRYPCNIYLNALVAILDETHPGPVDRVEVRMPWVPHLDCPAPRDLRQARNSAQAVAAIAAAGDTSYGAYSGPPGPWQPNPSVQRLLGRVELLMDRAAPTRLSEAVVGVRAWRADALVVDAGRSVRTLGGWGIEHARRLIGLPGASGSAEGVYGGSLRDAFDHVAAHARRRPVQPDPVLVGTR